MTISALTSGGCVPTKLITSTPPMLKPPATTLVRSGVKPSTFACFLIQSPSASQVPSADNAHTPVARKKALTTKSFVDLRPDVVRAVGNHADVSFVGHRLQQRRVTFRVPTVRVREEEDRQRARAALGVGVVEGALAARRERGERHILLPGQVALVRH